MRISRSVLAVGGVVLAGALITSTSPRVVHAVETAKATLVEVTNTAMNPVVTQNMGQQAGQDVYLSCSPVVGASTGGCYSIVNGEQSQSPFVVPANQSLVVTAVDINTATAHWSVLNGAPQCNAWRIDSLGVNVGAAGMTLIWNVTDNSSPTHFTYPTGVVFGPSSRPVAYSTHDYGTLDAACGGDPLEVYGYLTAN